MRPCATPGCSSLVKRGRCDRCSKRKASKPTENRAAWYLQARHWYDSARWRHQWQPRLLREQPLCVRCLAAGKTVPSEVADHIEPHRGRYERFWDWDNLQGLCVQCHNAKSRSERQ